MKRDPFIADVLGVEINKNNQNRGNAFVVVKTPAFRRNEMKYLISINFETYLNDESFKNRSQLYGDSFKITSVRSNDEGVYICTVETGSDVKEFRATLTVHSKRR